MIGVYIVFHPESGCFYIGSTGHFEKRKRDHIRMLAGRRHHCHLLQLAYNSDPALIWSFQETSDRAEAFKLEHSEIRKHWGSQLICNTLPFAQPGMGTIPESVREKISLARTGVRHTEETKARIALAKTGSVHSEETKALMSQQRKGKVKGPEWMDKIHSARRIAILVDGVVYKSIADAALAYSVSSATVLNRTNSHRSKWGEWSYP